MGAPELINPIYTLYSGHLLGPKSIPRDSPITFHWILAVLIGVFTLMVYCKPYLVGGFKFQPIWKTWVKMGSSSPIFGVNIKKSLSCHHLEMYEITTGNFVGLVFFGVSFSLMDLPFLNLDTKSSARQWYRHTTRQLKLTVSPATKIVGWKFLYNFLFGGSAYFQRLC